MLLLPIEARRFQASALISCTLIKESLPSMYASIEFGWASANVFLSALYDWAEAGWAFI